MQATTDSIFIGVKKLIGASEDDNGFDGDIIDFINSQFLTLYLIGVGDKADFTITGPMETWDDFTTDKSLQSKARTFVFSKVKRRFDPSASPTVDAAMQDSISEDTFYLNIQAEGGASDS